MSAPLKENRRKADKLRSLALDEMIGVFENRIDYGKDFKKDLLLKLTNSVLPRLTEVSGEDGEALQIIIKRSNDTNEGNTIIPTAGLSDIQSTEV
jgi:hypothetical protein